MLLLTAPRSSPGKGQYSKVEETFERPANNLTRMAVVGRPAPDDRAQRWSAVPTRCKGHNTTYVGQWLFLKAAFQTGSAGRFASGTPAGFPKRQWHIRMCGQSRPSRDDTPSRSRSAINERDCSVPTRRCCADSRKHGKERLHGNVGRCATLKFTTGKALEEAVNASRRNP
jgi:hypothetical protein